PRPSIPSSICHSTKRWKPCSSTAPFLKGVISAVFDPWNLTILPFLPPDCDAAHGPGQLPCRPGAFKPLLRLSLPQSPRRPNCSIRTRWLRYSAEWHMRVNVRRFLGFLAAVLGAAALFVAQQQAIADSSGLSSRDTTIYKQA